MRTSLPLKLAAATLVLAAGAAASCAAAEPTGLPVTVALDADFDDHPVDQPVGTGGAAAGEPIYVAPTLSAIVREGSVAGRRLLELSNPGGGSSATTRFEFLDEAEYSSGTLHLDIELVVDEAANHNGVQVYLREQGGSTRSFLNLVLLPSGVLSVSGSGVGFPTFPGLVAPGPNRLELLADLDTRHIRVWLNDVQVGPAEGFRHDIEDRGIGRVIVGLAAHPTLRRTWLDHLRVGHAPADPLFSDGFEAVD